MSQIETDDQHTIIEYRSGYIEHVHRETGRRTDVLLDLHRRKYGRRTWKCARTHGGGAATFENVTRDEAMSRCARELGPVLYTDDTHGFIFYRDASGVQGTTEFQAPMPR